MKNSRTLIILSMAVFFGFFIAVVIFLLKPNSNGQQQKEPNPYGMSAPRDSQQSAIRPDSIKTGSPGVNTDSMLQTSRQPLKH
jgi:cbb3-type cytochrome oxidase subunit 3